MSFIALRTRLPQSSSALGKTEPDDQHKEIKGEKHKNSLFLGDSSEDVPEGKDSMYVTQLKNYHPVIGMYKDFHHLLAMILL